MKLRSILVAVAAVTAFTLSSSAMADLSVGNRAGAVTVSPMAGGYAFSSHRKLKDTFLPVLGLGYSFTRHWEAEAYVGAFRTTNKKTPASDAQGQFYTLNGIYHFIPSFTNWQPYVNLGIGIQHIKNQASTEASSQAILSGALGLQYFFADSVALRLDGRDNFTMTNSRSDLLGSAGFTFLFGGHNNYRHMTTDATVQREMAHFGVNQAQITVQNKQGLNDIAHHLDKNPNKTVVVKGYASSTGAANYNLKLSKHRAHAAKQYLVKKGVYPSRIKTQAYGEAHPVASNATAVGRAKNRRVVAKVS